MSERPDPNVMVVMMICLTTIVLAVIVGVVLVVRSL